MIDREADGSDSLEVSDFVLRTLRFQISSRRNGDLASVKRGVACGDWARCGKGGSTVGSDRCSGSGIEHSEPDRRIRLVALGEDKPAEVAIRAKGGDGDAGNIGHLPSCINPPLSLHIPISTPLPSGCYTNPTGLLPHPLHSRRNRLRPRFLPPRTPIRSIPQKTHPDILRLSRIVRCRRSAI